MNATIGKQVWTLLILGASFVVFTAIGAYLGMSSLADKTSKLYHHPYKVSNAVRDVEYNIVSIHRTMKDIAISNDEQQIKNYQKEVDQRNNAALEEFKIIESQFLGDMKRVTEAKNLFVAWKVIRDEVIKLSLEGNKEAAVTITRKKGADHINKINTSVGWLKDFAKAKGDQFYHNSQKFQKKVITYFIVGVLLVIGLLVGVSALIIRKLNSKLKSAGLDLTNQSEYFEKSVDDISTVGLDLLTASEKQIGLVESTKSTFEDFKQSAIKSNETTINAANIADTNKAVASEGKDSLTNLIEGVEDIKAANGSVAQTVKQNNEEIGNIVHMIQEISEKTQIINDIVFQTKLLSFNASVEAARAGEHGKGFAVVAEEIGNLASLSGKAATEINEMLEARSNEITDLVKKSQETIEKMVTSARNKIQNGLDLAHTCQDKFSAVTTNAAQVNSLIHNARQMAEQQLKSIEAIQGDVASLHSLGLEYSENSNKTNETAMVLSSKHEELNSVIVDLNALIEKKAS